jgi:hypothetical protein
MARWKIGAVGLVDVEEINVISDLVGQNRKVEFKTEIELNIISDTA